MFFPPEINHNILERLDFNSIMQYSAVCKQAHQQVEDFFEDLIYRLCISYDNSISSTLQELSAENKKSSKSLRERMITLIKSPYGPQNIPVCHLAIVSLRDVRALKILINVFKRELEVPHPAGYTLLHTAATHGRAEIVQELLQNGWDVDEKSFLGNTALTLAESGSSRNKSAVLSLLNISLTKKTSIN